MARNYYSFKPGDMVTRNPTKRWSHVSAEAIGNTGIILKQTYLAYENKDGRFKVMWSNNGGSWVEELRADYLVLCNEQDD